MSDADHPFDEATTLVAAGDHRWTGHTHAGYGNMVGPFGGITAAQALRAVLLAPDRLGEPISATFNFCAALADGPFVAEARAARTNRSTQHWTVTLSQGEAVVMTATVVTAQRRAGWGHDEHAMPAVPTPAEVPRTVREKAVAWLQRYEMRFIDGHFPGAWDGREVGDSRSRLWVRDDPPRPLDAASLTAMADTFFPRIWRRRALPVPIGTVSMTVYFHADAAQLAATGKGFLLGQAQAQAFRGGFFDQSAQLWNEAGELLATSHQVVYYKAG